MAFEVCFCLFPVLVVLSCQAVYKMALGDGSRG